jgi:hypothetical protein
MARSLSIAVSVNQEATVIGENRFHSPGEWRHTDDYGVSFHCRHLVCPGPRLQRGAFCIRHAMVDSLITVTVIVAPMNQRICLLPSDEG